LFPEKTAVAGFIRRHKLMEFEKCRLKRKTKTKTLGEQKYRLWQWPHLRGASTVLTRW
jgi:hypothetical protein